MGDGLEYLNKRGGTVWNLADVAYQNGARIHSNSWGGACHDLFGQCIPGCTMPYDSFARDADLAMWTYPDLLMVYSAGNAGQFCPPPIAVGTPAIAKSPLTVGLGRARQRSRHSVRLLEPRSGRGRQARPALAAQGESTVSAASDANPASEQLRLVLARRHLDVGADHGGARGARARVLHGRLLRDRARATPAQGFAPQAALVKATLIDGAVALGAAAPEPDFDSGFGRDPARPRRWPSAGSPFQLRVRRPPRGHRDRQRRHPRLRRRRRDAAARHARLERLPRRAQRRRRARERAEARGGRPVRDRLVPDARPGDGRAACRRRTRRPARRAQRRGAARVRRPAAGRWIVRVRGRRRAVGPAALRARRARRAHGLPAPRGAARADALDARGPPGARLLERACRAPLAYNVYRSFGACPGGPWVPVATRASPGSPSSTRPSRAGRPTATT